MIMPIDEQQITRIFILVIIVFYGEHDDLVFESMWTENECNERTNERNDGTSESVAISSLLPFSSRMWRPFSKKEDWEGLPSNIEEALETENDQYRRISSAHKENTNASSNLLIIL